MKRILIEAIIVAGLFAICTGSYLAYAESGAKIIAQASAGNLVVDDSQKVIEMVFPKPGPENFPSYFTFYSNDATAFWVQRRFNEGIRDTVPIPIPAGRSIKIPRPDAVLDSDGANWRITIFVGGHTDSVFALPWYE